MFKVTKALKKLIECSIGDGTKHCNGYVTFAELNAIFESGQSDEPETMFATACCELMKRVASIEERLARIEKIIGALQRDLPEPSKSTELNKACEEFYKGDGWKPMQSKAEGKTPDYLMGIEGKTPEYLGLSVA